ncbi:hypothetical protein RFM45_004405 [Vibrio vulnificus]|nr:hypothetical protein [Vibrio vulnificus]
MSGSLALEKIDDDPSEEFIKLEIANLKIEIKFGDRSRKFTNDELDYFKEAVLKLMFARATTKISKRHRDNIQVSSIELRNGSIWVEAGTFLMLVANHPVAQGAMGGILSTIVVKNLHSPRDKIEYKLLMQRISSIMEAHASEIGGTNFHIDTRAFSIFDPKRNDYYVSEFQFHARDLNEIRSDVKTAIDDYHRKIGK